VSEGGLTVAAVVRQLPRRIALTLPAPDRSEIEALRRLAGDPRLTSNQQSVAQQRLRVAEVMYEKDNWRVLAARAVIPAICRAQGRFLVSGDRTRLVDVSLAGLARPTTYRPHEVGLALEGYAIEAPIGVVPVDDLVGFIGHGQVRAPVLDLDPSVAIPVDDHTDRAAYEGYLAIFARQRQRILDPVLMAEDLSIAPRGYVVQGHHRAAAAFRTGVRIRTAVLRRPADLALIQEGLVADLARECRTFSEFIDKCRRRAERLGLTDGGWPAWLAGM
jgi:hypothetical protein